MTETNIQTVIILVNYNSANDTKSCIQSVLDSDNQKQPFIILIDNNSSESLKCIAHEFPEVKIIKNDSNAGFGKANNIGIEWAKKNLEFDFLCLLNNDTVVERGFLQKLIAPFLDDPQVGITTGRIYYESNQDIIWYGGGDINYSRGWPKITNFNQTPSSEGALKSREVTFASGCLMMFSKESILKIGGFDEFFFMYCEDLELSIRTLKFGYKIYYNSDAIIYHKVQGDKKMEEKGLKIKNPKLKFLFINMKRNQFYTFNKHLKGFKKLRFKSIFFLELLYISSKFFFLGQLNIFLWWAIIFKQKKNIF